MDDQLSVLTVMLCSDDGAAPQAPQRRDGGDPPRDVPYLARRSLLEQLRWDADRIRIPPYWPGQVQEALEWTREHRLEGNIAKRLVSRYSPGKRSASWIKGKHLQTAGVTIVGWYPAGSAPPRCGACSSPSPMPTRGGSSAPADQVAQARLTTALRAPDALPGPHRPAPHGLSKRRPAAGERAENRPRERAIAEATQADGRADRAVRAAVAELAACEERLRDAQQRAAESAQQVEELALQLEAARRGQQRAGDRVAHAERDGDAAERQLSKLSANRPPPLGGHRPATPRRPAASAFPSPAGEQYATTSGICHTNSRKVVSKRPPHGRSESPRRVRTWGC